MSITSADERRTHYAPVVPTTEFAAAFPVFDNDDIKVFVDGEERDDFAVSATYVEGISTDAKAVFAEGITGSVDVVGGREPKRTNRFGAGAPVPTRDLNLAFDTVESEVQEAHRDIKRSHRAPYGEEGGVFSADEIGNAQGYAEAAEAAVEATAALVTQAEGIRDDVQELRDDVESMAAGVEYPVSYAPQSLSDAQQLQAQANIGGIPTFDDLSVLEATTVPANISLVNLRERVAGKGGGAMWAREASEPDVPASAKTQDDSGAWWKIDIRDVITPEMLGAFPFILVDADTKAWYDACSVPPTYLHLMHMDRMIRRLKWRGLWSKIKALYAFGARAKADAGINIKSPGTLNATLQGTGTFTAGVGYKGSSAASAYVQLPAWNNLLSQNAAFIAASYIAASGTEPGYLVSSLAGTASGVALTPYNESGNFSARLNGATATNTSRESRYGQFIVTRESSTSFSVYQEGELWRTATITSTAVTTDTGQLLRSSTTGYSNDTIRLFVAGNVALDAYDADALDWIIKRYVDAVGGYVNSGPECDEIGFTQVTSAADMATAMNDASSLASRYGAKVRLGLGTYLVDGPYAGMKEGVETYGVHRRGTVVASDSADLKLPVISPGHYIGGESRWSLHNFTVDGRAYIRSPSGTGTYSRPGPSNISTDGSVDFDIYDVDTIDPVLHGIDLSNTGEVDTVSGERSYAVTSHPDRWDVGVRGRAGRVYRIVGENCGDDHVTAHYFDGDGGFVHDIEAYWSSGRHSGGVPVSHAVEFDDGCRNANVARVYARSLGVATAAKCHEGSPAPVGCTFEDITAECCGRGVQFIDDNALAGVNTYTNVGGMGHLRGLIYTRPREWLSTHETWALLFLGVEDVSAEQIKISARGDETFLRAAVAFSTAAKRISVTKFNIKNWRAQKETGDATIRIGGTTMEDVHVSDGAILRAGSAAIRDTGGARSEYSNITLSGTGVSGSYGLLVSGGGADVTTRAIKFADEYSAGVSGFQTETSGV